MQFKVPLIGTIKTGKDSIEPEPYITAANIPQPSLKDKEKFIDILGGFVDISTNKLSTDKTVSTKILEANKEWVYRNNDVIAQEVSQIEFQLFQVGLKAGEIVYNEVNDHPVLQLLDKFNATTTRTDGIYNTQSHKKLTGDAFWYLERNGKQITNIYLLQPDKVELNLGDPRNGEPLVKSYTYRDIINGNKVEVTYLPEEIIHFKKPNPSNQFRGKGAVEATSETIDSDELANLTQRNFFRNGAITNFILSTDAKINEDQLKRLKAQLKASNNGAQNAYNTMILGGGLKPSSISQSNKEIEMIALMKWYRDKIMVAFGNTPASIGVIEDVNQANAQDTLATWKRGTIKPDMDAIVNTLNEFLVPLYGSNLILGYVNVVPEDRTSDVDEAVKLKQAGIITVNESRALLGYDTINGGDELSTNQPVPILNQNSVKERRMLRQHGRISNKSLGNVPNGLAHLEIKDILRKRGIFLQQKQNKQLKDSLKPLVKKYISAGKTKKAAVKLAEKDIEQRISLSFTNEEIMGFYEKQMNVIDVLEKQFEDAIKKFIKWMEKEALSNFDTQLQNKSTKQIARYLKKEQLDLFDDEAIKTQAQIDLTPILMNEITIAGQAAYSLIGKEDTYIPFNITNTVKENVAKFTKSMLDTDSETLSNLITDGINQGLSVPEIRDSITNKFETISKNQATVITRTEVMRASNMGNLDAYRQSGIVEAKQWLTAGATDECSNYEGKTESLDGSFYSSDSEFLDGDPPLHPNCRCVLIPVVSTGTDQPSASDISNFQDDQVIE